MTFYLLNTTLAVQFKPDVKVLRELTEAGDVAGLLAYLKPVEKDKLRASNYLVVHIQYPPSLSHGDVACIIENQIDPVVRPSGVCVTGIGRDRPSAVLRLNAPGCVEIRDEVPFAQAGVLHRDYKLEPLTKATEASFLGCVRFPSRRPAANAIVRICDTGVVVRTNGGGQFTAAGIPAGTFLVRAEAPGGEYHREMSFAAGQSIKMDLPLTAINTVGIRWALQTKEGLLKLTGEGVRLGEAHFSVQHSRVSLERGAETRETAGSDLMLDLFSESQRKYMNASVRDAGNIVHVGELVFRSIDSTEQQQWRNGLHREQAKFDDITAVNGGQPFDEKTYFEKLHGLPVRVGQVFTVRCNRRDCYAKIEIIAGGAEVSDHRTSRDDLSRRRSKHGRGVPDGTGGELYFSRRKVCRQRRRRILLHRRCTGAAGNAPSARTVRGPARIERVPGELRVLPPEVEVLQRGSGIRRVRLCRLSKSL